MTHFDNIQSPIFKVRGQYVMLDSDLASLYGVSTKRLNEQVKRNAKRFPIDFMFRLTTAEVHFLRSQIATSNRSRGGRRYLPLVFTEQGVAMLSTALTSERAIQVNIAIMRAFVKLRHATLSSRGVANRVEKLEGKVSMHETDIRLLAQDFEHLKENLTINKDSKKIRGFTND